MIVNRIGGLQSSLLSELTQILPRLAGCPLNENNLLSIKPHQPEDLTEVRVEKVLDMTSLIVGCPRTGDNNQVPPLKMTDTGLILVTEIDAGLNDRVYKLFEWIWHTVVPHRAGNQDNINRVDKICGPRYWVKQSLIARGPSALENVHLGLRML